MEALNQLETQHAGNLVEAVAVFRTYADAHPESTFVFSYLIRALRQTGDYDAAIMVCHERIAAADAEFGGKPLSSEGIIFRIAIGDILLQKNDAPGAIAHVKCVLHETKTINGVFRSIMYVQLGDAYRANGDLSAAKKVWNRALRYDYTGTYKETVAERMREIG